MTACLARCGRAGSTTGTDHVTVGDGREITEKSRVGRVQAVRRYEETTVRGRRRGLQVDTRDWRRRAVRGGRPGDPRPRLHQRPQGSVVVFDRSLTRRSRARAEVFYSTAGPVRRQPVWDGRRRALCSRTRARSGVTSAVLGHRRVRLRRPYHAARTVRDRARNVLRRRATRVLEMAAARTEVLLTRPAEQWFQYWKNIEAVGSTRGTRMRAHAAGHDEHSRSRTSR